MVIKWTGVAPYEAEFPLPGRFTSFTPCSAAEVPDLPGFEKVNQLIDALEGFMDKVQEYLVHKKLDPLPGTTVGP